MDGLIASPCRPLRASFRFLVLGFCLLAVPVCGRSRPPAPPAGGPDAGEKDAAGQQGPGDLQPFLQEIRARHSIPSLGALVLEGDSVAALGVVGYRKTGDSTAAESGDRYHLGSCTKAMTATLVAHLIEEGVLSWDTTIRDVFPHLEDLQPAFAEVTIDQLLRHRSGLSGNLPLEHGDLWMELWTRTDPVIDQRAWFAEEILKRPASGPVDQFSYSNAGYMVVGAMLEELTETPWEELISARLFAPLGMTECGFGAPASPGEVDQPWGHDGESSVAPGRFSDNPPALGPAGTVHCSLEAWSRFAASHLAGARGEDGYLERETYAKLHEPDADSSYAAGWGVAARDWAQGRVLAHDGSNTLFYASVILAPERDIGILVVTNRGDEPAQLAVAETVEGLVARFAP